MSDDQTDVGRPLTLREARFVDAYVSNGGNGAAAAREAGYAPGAARVTASEILAKPNVRNRMLASWDAMGLTEEAIGASLLRNLAARKEQAVATKDGGVQVVAVDDPASQVQAAHVAAKIRGMLPDPRIDVAHSVSGAVVVQHLDGLGPDVFGAGAIEGEAREL